MNRLIVCLALGAAFFFYRGGGIPSGPAPTPAPAVTVIPGLAKFRQTMTADDRNALAQCYEILGRAVEANPADQPVIETTAALSAVHRAALLFVYRGVLGKEPGHYPGLREELEGLFNTAVGTADVPLNPAIQRSAATTFRDIALSLR